MSGHEWMLHSHQEGRGGGTPRGQRPSLGLPLPLLYKEGWELPLDHTLAPLSLVPLLHLPAIRLAKPWQILFSTTPHRRAVEFSGRSSSSTAPLDQGNGGRHQAVCVTEYRGAARCSVHLHDLRSTSDRLHYPRESFSKRFRSSRVSSLGTWFYPLLTSTRLDLGVLVVLTVGNFLFSMLRTHQWYQSRVYV